MPLVPHVAAGQVVASTWGNLVADHVVMRFTTAAQRTSQLTAPIAGQLTTLDDRPGVLWYWTGTVWAEAPRRIGWGGYTGGQAVASGATAPIVWVAEEFDTDGFGAAGSSTLTVPAALGGVYAVTAYIVVAGAPTAPSRVEIKVAGTTVAAEDIPTGLLNKTLHTTREVAGGQAVVVNAVNGNPGSFNYSATMRLFRVGP